MRAIFLIIILFIPAPSFAQPFVDSTGKTWPLKDPKLIKLNIDEAKILNADEKLAVKESIKGKVSVLLEPRKNDYHHDWDKGTVEWNPKSRNYSNHKVIIPDGTVVENVNFAQRKPHTAAIVGKNLTFRSCNLANNLIDPSWKIIESNTGQAKQTVIQQIDEGSGLIRLITQREVEQKDGTIRKEIDEETVFTGELNHQLKRFMP